MPTISAEQQQIILSVANTLGYLSSWEEIHNPYLFLQALTQKSYSNEHQDVPSNKTLAFYGDRVLELCVTGILMSHYSLEGEDTPWLLSRLQAGDYSPIKSNLVSRENLTKVARQLGISELIRTGEGPFQTEKDSSNLPGETLEALIGACALDSSYGDHFDFKRIDLVKMFQIVSKVLDLDNYLKNLKITRPNKKIKLTEEDDKNPLCTLNKLVMKGLISKPVCSFNEPTRDEKGRDIWECFCAVMGYPLLDSSNYYSNKADAKKEVVKKLIDMIKGAHPEFFC